PPVALGPVRAVVERADDGPDASRLAPSEPGDLCSDLPTGDLLLPLLLQPAALPGAGRMGGAAVQRTASPGERVTANGTDPGGAETFHERFEHGIARIGRVDLDGQVLRSPVPVEREGAGATPAGLGRSVDGLIPQLSFQRVDSFGEVHTTRIGERGTDSRAVLWLPFRPSTIPQPRPGLTWQEIFCLDVLSKGERDGTNQRSTWPPTTGGASQPGNDQ